MEYVQVPEPVDIYVKEQKDRTQPVERKLLQTLKFQEFVEDLLAHDAYWNESQERVEASNDVIELFAGKEPGEVVEVPESVVNHVRAVLKSPRGCFPSPLVARACLPFMHAFTKPLKKADVEKIRAEAEKAKNGASETAQA